MPKETAALTSTQFKLDGTQGVCVSPPAIAAGGESNNSKTITFKKT